MSHFTHFCEGETVDLGAHTFTADEIISFARRYDPQPFHVDAEAAKNSFLGGLCASGWHTSAIWMRLMTAHAASVSPPIGGLLTGLSPGFDKLRWLKPVFAGDTIRYTTTCTGKRKLNSRPGWGIVHSDNEGRNQHDAPVFNFKATVLLPISQETVSA